MRAIFQALYSELTNKRGFGKRPVLLARSRGGLMLYSWAVEHPDSVGGVAGIYPVCNIASYPGIARAAPSRPPEKLMLLAIPPKMSSSLKSACE